MNLKLVYMSNRIGHYVTTMSIFFGGIYIKTSGSFSCLKLDAFVIIIVDISFMDHPSKLRDLQKIMKFYGWLSTWCYQLLFCVYFLDLDENGVGFDRPTLF